MFLKCYVSITSVADLTEAEAKDPVISSAKHPSKQSVASLQKTLWLYLRGGEGKVGELKGKAYVRR